MLGHLYDIITQQPEKSQLISGTGLLFSKYDIYTGIATILYGHNIFTLYIWKWMYFRKFLDSKFEYEFFKRPFVLVVLRPLLCFALPSPIQFNCPTVFCHPSFDF